MHHAPLTLALLVSLIAGPTLGAPPGAVTPTDPSPSAQPRVDPKLDWMRRIGPLPGMPATAEGARGSLRMAAPLLPAEVRALEAAGVRFRWPSGLGRAEADEPVHLGAIYPAFIEWRALPALSRWPGLLRAEATAPPARQPLEVTTHLIGADASRRRLPDGLDGSGVLVADIDSAVDVLHPHLFFADGGTLAWIDADGDDRFTAGTDGVDFDGDGLIDGPLVVLDGVTLQGIAGMGGGPSNMDGALDPARDWLFADLDGDGRRGVGPSMGYLEVDPAYGEPLFVAEDIDGDGALDPGEPLVRLATSKVRKAVQGGRTYVRGVDLIESAESPAIEGALHGTGVASILLGGQPNAHDRVGIAPGAEILMYAASGAQNQFDPFFEQTEFVADAVAEGATLVLHEWSDTFWSPSDGSSNLERMMDMARAEGTLQVCPAGNLNRSEKTLEVEATGGAIELPFEVGDGFQYGPQRRPYGIVYLSLVWRAETEPQIEVTVPSGETVEVPPDGTRVGPVNMSPIFSVTGRGTGHLLMAVYRDDAQGQALPQGEWLLRISGLDDALPVRARIADLYSGWSVGVRWLRTTEDRGTLTYPSTADSAIGVAAYGGRHDLIDYDGSRAGELRGYSGRGPRFDGERGIDITAPDDPYAALAATPAYLQAGYGRSWFATFGGTSGAGPHVAGTVALLRQQHPEADADALEALLFEAAEAESDAPDIHWGYGRLATHGALFGGPAPSPVEPSVTFDVQSDWTSITFDATGSTDAARYRFDVENDGVWDTGWLAEASWTVDAVAWPAERWDVPLTARVEAASADGTRAGRLATYVVETPPPPPDMGPDQGPVDMAVITVVDADGGAGQAGGGGAAPLCEVAGDAPPIALLSAWLLLAALRRRAP